MHALQEDTVYDAGAEGECIFFRILKEFCGNEI